LLKISQSKLVQECKMNDDTLVLMRNDCVHFEVSDFLIVNLIINVNLHCKKMLCAIDITHDITLLLILHMSHF